jgi:hypothetical protein
MARAAWLEKSNSTALQKRPRLSPSEALFLSDDPNFS